LCGLLEVKATFCSEAEMVAVPISYFGEADTVQVAGDFSDGGGAAWQPEHLVNRGAGDWALVLHLLPGSYHYKLIVDGEWRLVEGRETETDALGHVNSILVVGHQEEGVGGEEEEASVAEEESARGKLGKGDFEQTLEVSLNDTPVDYNILHSEANASFGICLDISNDLFDASVDLTVKEDEGTSVARKGEEVQKVQPVDVASVVQKKVGVLDTKEDQIKVKRVALVRKGSSEGGEGPSKAGGAETKILSTTQKVLTSAPAFPSKINSNPRDNQLIMRTKVAAPTVPVKAVSKLFERDLKKSAGKVSEATVQHEKSAKDGSGRKPNTGNKENVCQQLLNMSLKAKEVKGKENNGKKLGTYKGLVVRNRTINAESDDEHHEDEVQANVVVEKAFVVTRVTKKDNVAQSRRATKGVLTKTSRPWKRV